jgi:hypothetical protein
MPGSPVAAEQRLASKAHQFYNRLVPLLAKYAITLIIQSNRYEPNRKKSKFECYGLLTTVTLKSVGPAVRIDGSETMLEPHSMPRFALILAALVCLSFTYANAGDIPFARRYSLS